MSIRIFSNGQVVEEWDDETRTYRRFGDEPIVRPYTEEEAAALLSAARHAAREVNRAALVAKVDAALDADLAYLESQTPALAADRLTRVETQVERLTRQVVALLRLVGDRLDDTAGT